ncbi:hypothetical protein [Paenibacillus sp. N3.4]|uniref:hypothetical protein n=1 Tax=Paenibacillus sp. N3.4 TaxID=2603222 RepID=UPI0011C87C07|nr:hypothetical protein [Paenibacillus sp. N3.4]TXK75445.1 hypothetical protein FU659_27560 [Paenibacillus sp. N3.4]
MMGYNCQMTIIGNYLKVKKYGKSIAPNRTKPRNTKAQRLAEIEAIKASPTLTNVQKQVQTAILEPLDMEEFSENRRIPKSRRLTLVERERFENLMELNFTKGHKYITLTYGKEAVSLDEASKDFENWMKRMRERYGDFKYLAVRSFQGRSTSNFRIFP